MAKSKLLNVNGKRVSVKYDDPQMPLLYALRDDLGLRGPRFGCGLGQCGACTVHIDGVAVRSCITPLATVEPKQKIVMLEGLAKGTKLHPLQQAFIDEQAVQCGYLCVPKTLSVLIGGGNHLTSAHNDRAAMLCPKRLGLAI